MSMHGWKRTADGTGYETMVTVKFPTDEFASFERLMAESKYGDTLRLLKAERDRYKDALDMISLFSCSGIGKPPSCGCRTCLARRAITTKGSDT